MSWIAKSRRLEATSLRNLAASPVIPTLSRMGRERLELLFGREDRAAHEALDVGLRLNEPIEGLEVAAHRVDGVRFLRELEQGRGVTPGDT